MLVIIIPIVSRRHIYVSSLSIGLVPLDFFADRFCGFGAAVLVPFFH
jgi:hypothetical protein